MRARLAAALLIMLGPAAAPTSQAAAAPSSGAAAARPSGDAEEAAAPLQGWGLEAPIEDAEAALAALPDVDAARTLLRIEVIVGAQPEADQSATLARIAAEAAPRARVVVALSEAAPVDVRDGAQVDAWVERVADLVDRAGPSVVAWEIGSEGARPLDEQSFFLKRTSLAIKGVRRDALVLGADPRALPGAELDEAAGPFLDGHVTSSESPVLGLVVRSGRRAQDSPALWEAIASAVARGEMAATFRLPRAALDSQASGIAAAFRTALAAFPADTSPTGNAPLVTFPPEAKMSATELVVASDLSTRVVVTTGLTGRLPAGAVLATFSEEPHGLRVFDPRRAEPVVPRAGRHGAGWAAEVPLSAEPIVLAWDRVRGEDDVEEKVAVATEVQPTVEEILARHFATQAARDRGVHSYVADLATEMRYELGASGQAFEVRVEGKYFFDETGVREIENERFFVNGAKFDPKKGRPPEIPLLQPETVQVLPLEVRLDKSYEYRLLGRDTREGRACWKVAFHPAGEGEGSRYAGIVWIDAKTWDRVAVDLSQTGLAPPVLTNEQTDTFGPVLSADGEHWLVHESLIHRTVSLLGGTVGVQMRMLFSNFRVNEPGFQSEHEQALASTHQMLRETDEGLKYLRPTASGGREVGETSSRKLFVVAGVRHDDSYESAVLPLAGVNWLDYDLGGKGIQIDVFAAGAINTLSIADPSLLGSHVTLGLDAFLPIVRRRDRFAVPGMGIDEEAIVRGRAPHLELEVSRPVGRHGRAALTAGIANEAWSADGDTADDYVVPSDEWLASLGAKGELHRHGWDSRFWASRSERSQWKDWGDPVAGLEDSEDHRGFWKWGANVAKTWPLGKLQTAGFDAQYLGGSALDRFSEYEFAAFGGTRLPGFDGSGIHFDEAALLRLSWGFDVAGVFGAQVQVGVGRTWTRSLPDSVRDAFGEDSDQVGVALTGTVPGPWGTIIRFDVGTALYSSDYDSAEGNVIAQVVVLKLLGK